MQMRKMVISVDEGDVTLTYPASLSERSMTFMTEWLALWLRYNKSVMVCVEPYDIKKDVINFK